MPTNASCDVNTCTVYQPQKNGNLKTKRRFRSNFEEQEETASVVEINACLSDDAMVCCCRGRKGFYETPFQAVDHGDHRT